MVAWPPLLEHWNHLDIRYHNDADDGYNNDDNNNDDNNNDDNHDGDNDDDNDEYLAP